MLADQWAAFAADPAARLLRWCVKESDLSLLDAFFELQQESTEFSVPDLFLKFETPFENGAQYAQALVSTLGEHYTASVEELSGAGFAADWCPFAGDGGDFVANLHSLREYHADTIDHVAAVLTPPAVTPGLAQWLKTLLAAPIPETIRIVVIDPLEAPQFSDLAERFGATVWTETPRLEAAAVMRETAAALGGAGPGPKFRNLLLGLAEIAGSASPVQLKKKSEQALSVARAQNWLDQQVVVHSIVAAAHLGAGRAADAIAAYQQSTSTGQQAREAGHPAGQKLVVSSMFGEASVYVSEQRYAEAAQHYVATSKETEKLEDKTLHIEALRMTSFCFEQAGQHEQAWQYGHLALDVGDLLAPEARQNTTLAYAGQGLLRVAGNVTLAAKPEAQQAATPDTAAVTDSPSDYTHQRMTQLLGAGWQQTLAKAGAA